ncbi:MAG: type II secretion system F family protein [Bryobacteraceae bacterium]|nr:type II secretion system F family protein [Bryobacteraceae bacterium]MCX7605215.1 type II secretion system F family protein [Bryobacteraceae bacterium]
MGGFLLVFLAVWGAMVGVWMLVSRRSRTAGAEEIRQRVLGSPEKKKAAARSKSSNAPLIAVDDHTTGKVVLRLMKKFELQDRLQRLLEQAGLKWKVARLVHSCLALFLVAFWLAWGLLPVHYRWSAFFVGAAAGCLPLMYVASKRKARLRKFEEQFPDSLEFMARSMRAGHAFSVSLEMLHREFQEPLAGEFRRAFEEHNLGMPLDVALQKLGQRVPSLDVHFFVSAVLLQKRTGGNLAEILDKLAYVIRERFKLRGKIRAISAHGRMTGMALTLIPIGVAAMMFIVNPDYVTFFVREEVGNMMMVGAIVLQVIGYMIIKKIVNIEV